MTIFAACLEQSIFSIQDDPGGFAADSFLPSSRNWSTSLSAASGVLLFTQRAGPSPSASVSAATSCWLSQYTPGLEGSLVPYLSYVILSTHQLSSFCV